MYIFDAVLAKVSSCNRAFSKFAQPSGPEFFIKYKVLLKKANFERKNCLIHHGFADYEKIVWIFENLVIVQIQNVLLCHHHMYYYLPSYLLWLSPPHTIVLSLQPNEYILYRHIPYLLRWWLRWAKPSWVFRAKIERTLSYVFFKPRELWFSKYGRSIYSVVIMHIDVRILETVPYIWCLLYE